MSVTMTITKKAVAGGKSSEEKRVLEGSSLAIAEYEVPPAKSGVLETRTDANTGQATMDPGHGFVDDDVVDVYWDGGKRLGMTAQVTGDSVDLDGGEGDDLPATSTALAVMKPVSKAFHFEGSDIIGLAVASRYRGTVRICGSDGDADVTYSLGDKGADNWSEGDNISNPIDGDTIAMAKFSHGNTDKSSLMKATSLVP